MSAALTAPSVPGATARVGQAVLQHRHAERAAGRDGVGAGLEGLPRPLGVDPRPARLLHPHPAAAGAAAERVLAAPLHLPQLEAGHRAEDVAR